MRLALPPDVFVSILSEATGPGNIIDAGYISPQPWMLHPTHRCLPITLTTPARFPPYLKMQVCPHTISWVANRSVDSSNCEVHELTKDLIEVLELPEQVAWVLAKIREGAEG